MGASQRRRGQVYEREIAAALSEVFPDARRNWMEQSAVGGVDLANTEPFNIEVKGGKQANIAKTRKWLDQVAQEGNKTYWDVVVCRPLREDNYVLMPFDDFVEILVIMKKEGII